MWALSVGLLSEPTSFVHDRLHLELLFLCRCSLFFFVVWHDTIFVRYLLFIIVDGGRLRSSFGFPSLLVVR